MPIYILFQPYIFHNSIFLFSISWILFLLIVTIYRNSVKINTLLDLFLCRQLFLNLLYFNIIVRCNPGPNLVSVSAFFTYLSQPAQNFPKITIKTE